MEDGFQSEQDKEFCEVQKRNDEGLNQGSSYRNRTKGYLMGLLVNA